jgi:pimeloyl-ACP methyl ester carboxylesterase
MNAFLKMTPICYICPMQLYYRKFGETGDQPIIILHGIFGTSDNWFSYARRLSQEGFEVFTLDQRNHGQSPHSDIFNYLAMTDDLFDFIDEHDIEDPIILGHSMGGKVAMRFALENPQLVSKLIVVDISLKAYGPRKQHRSIIQAMKSVDLSALKNRSDVEEQISQLVPEIRIRQFIMKNLHRKEKDEFEWRINIPGIEKNLDQLFDGIDTITKFDKPTLFVKGGASDYILLDDYDQIRYNFPNAEIITIADASHWVHVESPERFYQLTMGFAGGNPSWYDKEKPV